MSIKGTLETFNLCELLQMLAFNQKEGTLVLDSETGGRTLYLDKGQLGFLEDDDTIAASIIRMARRDQIAADARIEEAAARAREGGRPAQFVLEHMGLLDAESATLWYRDAVVEQLFAGQLASVAGFEFVEGKALGPNGAEGRPIRPTFPVESLLLDVARMLDHWNTIIEVVPSGQEIYEGTGIGVDLEEDEEIDESLAEVVIPRIDGYRTLAQIAEACHATLYSVMHIAATLFDGGGIRAVPTTSLVTRGEDLLARGEAAAAIPLLQRAIERGDAPVEARLRLADAFEASDMLEDAATALDTFAALSPDDNAAAVFDALCRTLRIRDGELATAARVCDYYLRRRPWLQEYRSMAVGALRDLIQGATSSGRPLEAATRLEEFIKVGDSPAADRNLLADLFALGGDGERAGAALFEEAQALLTEDKRIPARQALRRVLEHDGGHADARRLLLEMDGARKRTHHRARVVGIMIALILVAAGAGVAWFGYQDSASVEVGSAESLARAAMESAEELAREKIAAFMKRAEAASNAVEEDTGLGDAAQDLRREIQEIMAVPNPAMAAYAAEIDRYAASGNDTTHRSRHERLAGRRMVVTGEAEALLRQFVATSATSFQEGAQAHASGQFEAARLAFRQARNLAFENTTIRNDAIQKLRIVDEYYEISDRFQAEMKAATEARDFERAFAIGVAALKELLDSDLSRQLAFPLSITSTPPGAEIWIGGEDTGARTPCDLTYTPFLEHPYLALRSPGCETVRILLPAYEGIRRNAAPAADWKPVLHGTMSPGLRWRTRDGRGALTSLWAAGDIPVVVGNRGRNLFSVDAAEGVLTQGSRVERGVDLIRAGGRLTSGAQWSRHGQRTVRIQPPGQAAWSTQTVGRIRHAPIEIDGLIVVVDELGMVYAYDGETGARRWRFEAGVPSSQGVYASPMGVLLGTANGSAYKLETKRGQAIPLAPGARGSVYVLPLGDHAVLISEGAGGIRLVGPDGGVKSIGVADPRFDRTPLVTKEGVAWIERDGTVRFLASPASAPCELMGLGRASVYLGSSPGRVYAATANGTLRAVTLTTPEEAIFQVPLGAPASAPPLHIGNTLYVLVDGDLVAVEI